MSAQTNKDGSPRKKPGPKPKKTAVGNPEGGRVLKVLFFDEKMEPVGEWASQQISEDPFGSKGLQGLQNPPYPPEQLMFLAESHPIHDAALEQKVADVVGAGWEWVPDEESDEADRDEEQRKELNQWFSGLSDEGEESMHEQLTLVEDDVETCGWGLLEVIRDDTDEVVRLIHIPAHTTRFAVDGIRIAQMRGGKKAWFRRWGAPEELPNGKSCKQVHRTRGTLGDDFGDDSGHEVLVFKKPSRRSSWYGIPGYISAVGWITLGLATRDDNLLFFQNRREPRWAVILTNLQDDPTLADELEQSFKVDLKQPHRNLLIPITGKGEVEFKKLSSDRAEGSFEKLEDRSDLKILVAHRVPAERLGIGKVGPLGGEKTAEASRIYKEGVVAGAQALLSVRLNRFIRKEFPAAKAANKRRDEELLKARRRDPSIKKEKDWSTPWLWKPKDLDLGHDKSATELAVLAYKNNLVPLREARLLMGYGPLPDTWVLNGQPVDAETEGAEQLPDPRNDWFYADFLPGSAMQTETESESAALIGEGDDRLAEINSEIRDLMSRTDENEEGVQRLKAEAAQDE